MELKKSVRAYGTEDFEKTLTAELNDNPFGLPLEAGCEHGGFPDMEDEVNVYKVSNIHDDERRIFATISITFTEAQNTSCGDVQIPHHHEFSCSIEIEKETGDCDFEPVERDYEPEF